MLFMTLSNDDGDGHLKRERHLQSEFALPRTRLIRRMLANLFGVEF